MQLDGVCSFTPIISYFSPNIRSECPLATVLFRGPIEFNTQAYSHKFLLLTGEVWIMLRPLGVLLSLVICLTDRFGFSARRFKLLDCSFFLDIITRIHTVIFHESCCFTLDWVTANWRLTLLHFHFITVMKTASFLFSVAVLRCIRWFSFVIWKVILLTCWPLLSMLVFNWHAANKSPWKFHGFETETTSIACYDGFSESQSQLKSIPLN